MNRFTSSDCLRIILQMIKNFCSCISYVSCVTIALYDVRGYRCLQSEKASKEKQMTT